MCIKIYIYIYVQKYIYNPLIQAISVFERIKIKCANLDVRNVVHMKTSNSSEATGEMLFSV